MLTEDQVNIILWCRRVFLHSQEMYIKESKKIEKNQKLQFGKYLIDHQYEQINMANVVKNGGISNLNFIIQILNKAFFGNQWHKFSDINVSKLDNLLSTEQERFQIRKQLGYIHARKNFMQILINLNVSDILIGEKGDAGEVTYNYIFDYQKDKQLIFESQFILWKFLAILKYSDVELDQFIVTVN